MSGFTKVFGGQTIYPSNLNYRGITLTEDLQLVWGTELASSNEIVADIMAIDATAPALSILMPPADGVTVGQSTLYVNVGAETFSVTDSEGTMILSVAPGTAWDLWITDNSTAAGLWDSVQRGAAASSSNVAALAGKGLKAITTTLNQDQPVTLLGMDYEAGAPDRAASFVWTGGAGAFELPAGGDVGNGWFVAIRNGGSGSLVVTPAAGNINGASSISLQPGDSIEAKTDGVNYYTYGLGQSATFAFDYTEIDVSGIGDYTLAGSELNRIAYKLTGTLTGNRDIIVPATTQQYWINNATTGAFTLGVRTSTQASQGLVVAQGAQSIMYCDGTDVVDADSQGISTPVSIAQGGTGATTAGGALTNLGGTSVGVAVFTAANAAAARTALALGTMAAQDASAVAITGGTIAGTSISSAPAIGATSTDAGASAGPVIDVFRNSASPAAADLIGVHTFTGKDSAGNTEIYAVIDAQIDDPTSTTEDGQLRFSTIIAGALAKRGYMGNGLVWGVPTGGDKGAGTINAVDLFVNGNSVAAPATPYTAQTSGYTATLANKGGVINFTTAGVTLQIDPVATIGAGYTVTIMNTASSGNITIDPNGSETLDGLTTRVLEPGNIVTIVCTGAALITKNGIYTKTSATGNMATAQISTAHGFPRKPTRLRGIAICTSTDGTYAVGNVLEMPSIYDTNATSLLESDTTNFVVAGFTRAQVGVKSGGIAPVELDETKWNVQAIAFDVY